MYLQKKLSMILGVSCLVLLGCTDNTMGLKQQIAEMEKRVQKQEKDLREFAGKFAPPKDFSADIQRMEDQQDRITQAIKTKVDPVNSKLEELRDWAQEAQKEREITVKKMKSMEQALLEAQKRLETDHKESLKNAKEAAAERKAAAVAAKNIEELSKGLGEVKRDLQDNNEKIVNAVKKTLPKVKEAAVSEITAKIAPLEQNLASLKQGMDNDRRVIASLRAENRAVPEPVSAIGRDNNLLMRRIKELEEIVGAQKSFLLEMGARMHELELHLKRLSELNGTPYPAYSRRSE